MSTDSGPTSGSPPSWCGRNLVIHSTWGLFSPRGIDKGTQLLLKYLRVRPADDCLDLECDYGPIGLAIAVLARRDAP